jgi:hypothetical protein
MPPELRWLHGPRLIGGGDEDAVVISLVRDGGGYVDPFIRYHQRLGARQIVIVDNGSVDGTVEAAQAHHGVSVWRCTGSFREEKNAIRAQMVQQFCHRRWGIYLDIDERLAYPGSDRYPLPALLGYLRRHGYTAVVGQMLDLFPERPLLADGESADLYRDHRFYDLRGLRRVPYRWRAENVVSNPEIASYLGGIRGRTFGIAGLLLTKHPLFFGAPAMSFFHTSSHSIRGARLADFTVAVLHVKFTGDFPAALARALREKSYWNASRDYQAYAAALARDPQLTLWSPHAHELRSIDELVDRGFLTVSPRYRRFALGEGRADAGGNDNHAQDRRHAPHPGADRP